MSDYHDRRVRAGDDWLYIYILLEFQSGVDRWMAPRMQTYVGLLYQDLVKRDELAAQSMLPPVLPLVFYNGSAPWTARRELAEMMFPAPEGLAEFQASQRYFLIDQQRLDPAVLCKNRGVLNQLFRMELFEDASILGETMAALVTWIGEDA